MVLKGERQHGIGKQFFLTFYFILEYSPLTMLWYEGNYKQGEWEKIIANEATDKELISKIHKQIQQLNSRKINDPIKNGPKN